MGPLTSKKKKGFIFSAYYDICGGRLGKNKKLSEVGVVISSKSPPYS